jgi:pimeloyl-ACP methyl ester carboxylesterase
MQGVFHGRFPKIVLLLGLALLAGCVRQRPVTAPIPTLSLPGAGHPRTLVVLLPGRRDSPEDFRRFDFPGMAAQAGADVDMVAVDAHLGYYFQRSIVDRLHDDVIAPARKKYDRIWIAGISIGGTGAILYANQHPEDLDGIVLLAPFLGEEDVIGEVSAAGGLRGWTPPAEIAPDDFQRRLWAWLKTEPEIPIYLGWGRSDSFARANGMLGQILSPERVFTAPGGHGWKAWKAIWEMFLKTGALNREPGAGAPPG